MRNATPRPIATRLATATRWLFTLWTIVATVSGVCGDNRVVAQDTLMQASGARQTGRWKAMNNGKIEFQQDKKPLDAVALEDVMWLRLEGDAPERDPRKSPHTVTIVGSGWAQGSIKQWDDRHLQLETKAFGVLAIPSPLVKSVQWKSGAKPAQADKEDVLHVRTPAGSLQALQGKVLGLRDGALGFQFQGENRRVKLASLVRADLARGNPPSPQTQLTVNWPPLGGIPIKAVKRPVNGPMELTTLWDQKLKGGFPGASFSVSNGRVVLLSSLEPASAEHTPYFDIPFPYQRQAASEGWRLGGNLYTQGLLTHSHTVLTYQLEQRYAALHATVGIDDAVGNLGNADVQIQVDGEMVSQWTAIGGKAPKTIEVKLTGASKMSLVVDFGKEQDIGDRVVWGNARLLRTVIDND